MVRSEPLDEKLCRDSGFEWHGREYAVCFKGCADTGESLSKYSRAEVHRRDVRPPGHRLWAAHHPRRSRASDDLKTGGALTRRPRRDETHARPHVSNDNPFSEAQFKTLKYRPDFPARFGSIEDVRAHCDIFFPWYNVEHHHSGLGLLTPYDVHSGLAEQRVAARATVLATAYPVHPERFPRGLPRPPARPEVVWINPPETPSRQQTLAGSPAPPGGVLDHARPGQLLSAHCSDLHARDCSEVPE